MAYFSNSSEGDALEAICSRCVHLDSGDGCVVLTLQFCWNYDQHAATEAGKAKRFALNELIPQKDGKIECKMFIAKAEAR